MKAEHTPGPWFTLREGFSAIYVEARIEGGMLQEVAMCGPTKEGQTQQEANARLIASAPDLLEALCDLIDSHWLEDSHAVDFDGTILFSQYYDLSNLHCHRRTELRLDGFECVIWPGGYPDFKWSAYSTYEGSLWFEQFDSEAEARAVCTKLLADVMPEHPVAKAFVAVTKAVGESQ